MVSCLEKVSITARHEQMVRSDYSRDNQYSATHKNALAGDDSKGKGTGHKGHTFWLPNCNGTLGAFNYSNFDTAVASNAGNADDREARKIALARSMYNAENQYSATIVDTNGNVMEGQYVVK